MNIHNSELSKQNEANKAARARMGIPNAAAVNIGFRPSKRQIELEAENTGLKRTISRLEAKIETIGKSQKFKLADDLRRALAQVQKLKLNLADAQARILAQAEIICQLSDTGEPVDDELVDEGLPAPRIKRPVFAIIEEVLREFPDVTWDEVKSISRTRRLVEPRQACIWAIHVQRPDLSLPAIGRVFARDHTTVLHAVRKVRAAKAAASDGTPGAPIEFIQT